MRALRLAAITSLCAIAAPTAGPLAAETTDAERWALELRRSEDRQIELLGQRWSSLIERQTWTDESGRFTVTAKYVSHSEDLSEVTLLASRRTDDGRVEKKITVPLDKLGKISRARVHRIVRLKPKIEEKLAEVAAAQAAEDEQAAEVGDGRRRVAGGEAEPTDGGRRPPPGPAENAESPPAERQPGRPPVEEAARAERSMDEQPTAPGAENPYGGSRFITRDRLVDDQRLEGLDNPPQAESPTAASRAGSTNRDIAASLTSGETPMYVVDVPAEPREFLTPEGTVPVEKRAGWTAVEAKHEAMVRTVPSPPAVGRPTRLQLIVTTEADQPRPQVLLRKRDSSPGAAAGWVEMNVVGGTYFEPSAYRTLPVQSEDNVLQLSQAGETHYQLGLQLPPGLTAFDLQFVADGEASGPISPPALELRALSDRQR